MTTPTLLGTGGHGPVSHQCYGSGYYYSNVGLGRCAMRDSTPDTESYTGQIIRVSGTVSYLSWALETGIATQLTLSLSQNSVSSGLAITIDEDTSGWVTDSTDSVDVSSGDVLNFATHVETSGEYSTDFYCVSARFDATTASAQLICCAGPNMINVSSAVAPVSFLGVESSGIYSETSQQIYALLAGTWRNLACNIENNFTGTATTITNRLNGGNGSMAISVSESSTGYFEDTGSTHRDSVSYGDYMNYGFLYGSGETNTLDCEWIGAHFVASTASDSMIGGAQSGIEAMYAGMNSPYYTSLFGGGNIGSYVPRATGLVPYAMTASKFATHVADVLSGAATFAVLQNGSATPLSVSASDTGLFITSAFDTVDFAQGDTCANRATVTSSPGTSITWVSATLFLDAT